MPLVERLFAAVSDAGIEAELIIVDDNSRDGTVEAVDALSAHYPVRVVVREDERGLSGAVLAGFAEAKYDRFVVLDADLQHPPEKVPELLARLEREGCDFVIGSRYGAGGAIRQDWPLIRRLGSKVATMLAAPLVPLSDPMSGFFGLRRETWASAARIDPIGYKIALELYVKGGCRAPGEIPIEFSARTAGKSKLGAGVFFKYLQHLARLYRFRFPWLPWCVAVALVAAVVVVVLLAR